MRQQDRAGAALAAATGLGLTLIGLAAGLLGLRIGGLAPDGPPAGSALESAPAAGGAGTVVDSANVLLIAGAPRGVRPRSSRAFGFAPAASRATTVEAASLFAAAQWSGVSSSTSIPRVRVGPGID